MNDYDIIIIGAGASGIMAAISTANAGLKVCILEKTDRLGKKILVTGNGRCNLSNQSINNKSGFYEYHNQNFARIILETYNHQRIDNEFYLLGLLTKSDHKGWVYPYSKSANSVVNVLLAAMRSKEVHSQCNTEVTKINAKQDHYELITKDNVMYKATTVIVANAVSGVTNSLDKLLHVVAQPILGPIKTDNINLKGLDGLRIDCSITLYRNKQMQCQEFGQVQFKKSALSGIAVFQMSRFAKPGDVLALNFMPHAKYEQIRNFFRSLKVQNPNITALESLAGIAHKHLSLNLLKAAQIDSASIIDESCLDSMIRQLTDFRFNVLGLPGALDAQVMRGGLDVSGFDPTTLESKSYPGLYAVGESLDVDGPCGGFNLHWAWASGIVAGKAAGKIALDRVAANKINNIQ